MAYFRCLSGSGGGGREYFNETAIYNKGIQSGYTALTSCTSGQVAEDKGTYMECSFTNGTNRWSYICFKVDVTNVDCVLFNITENTSGITGAKYVFVSTTQPNSAAAPNNSPVVIPGSTTNTPCMLAFNTTSLSGEHYIGFGAYSGPTATYKTVKCDQIILVTRK